VNTIEVRCPNGPQKLFTKLKLGEEFAQMVPEQNLIEFTCRDCARAVSRQRNEPVRVFHRFNFLGELVTTVIQTQWECRISST
jgi:hypothetical protein